MKNMKEEKTKKIDKALSKILFNLTECEKYGFVEVPDDWEVLADNKGKIVCSCRELVEVEYFPYAFDKENNEVHYIAICPKCGDFIYFCD